MSLLLLLLLATPSSVSRKASYVEEPGFGRRPDDSGPARVVRCLRRDQSLRAESDYGTLRFRANSRCGPGHPVDLLRAGVTDQFVISPSAVVSPGNYKFVYLDGHRAGRIFHDPTFLGQNESFGISLQVDENATITRNLKVFS